MASAKLLVEFASATWRICKISKGVFAVCSFEIAHLLMYVSLLKDAKLKAAGT